MLPFRLDVVRARREAKALLASARRGDRRALARLRSDRPPVLADAQHAIARQHGYRNWAELVATAREPERMLRAAARAGDDDTLLNLLADGVDPNAPDPTTGWTALHHAVAADQLATVAVLVGWVPVDKRRRDRDGRTPLQLAPHDSPAATMLARFESSATTVELRSDHAAMAAAIEVQLLDRLAHAPGAERWPVGDGFAFRTGLDDNTRNGVVAGSASVEEVADVQARLAGLPASWHATGTGFSPDLAAALDAAGCKPERDAVHMHADLTSSTSSFDERVVETRDASALVGLDPTEAALLLAGGRGVRAFVIEGAATAITFVDGSTVLGLHLHVERTHRRRGIGRALVLHAAAAARASGASDAVLSPTAATIPYYELLGFTLERDDRVRCYYL